MEVRVGRKQEIKEKENQMKLVGILVILAGWALAVFGLGLTHSTGLRMILALVGIVISLVGILSILVKAHEKEAPWKV
jgi:hypothetical protein